jgi:hypothetical protein
MPATSPHTTQAAASMLEQLFRAERFDRKAWEMVVAEDIHMRIGNAVPVIGKVAVMAELETFFDRVQSVGDSFWEVCRRRDTIFVEVEIHFIDVVGADRLIPCVIVARLAGGNLLDLRFDLDPSPIPQ